MLPKALDYEIVKQILSYFLRNPKAVDSLEGVARWRILQEQIHRSVEETGTAMAWLVEQGFLEKIEASGSVRLFRLNPARQLDAARLVGEKRQRQRKR